MDDLRLELINGIYDMGFPIESYVTTAVITAEQYKQITGKEYAPTAPKSTV